MKKITVLFAILMAFGLSNIKAQGFGEGSLTVGATLGVSYGGAFGVTGDYGLTDNWSIGGDVFYTSYTSFYKYSLVGILAAGSYHFMPNDQWDPYLKGGLGFFNWSDNTPDGWNKAHSSSLGFILQAGCRYYFNDQIAARVSLGYPYYVGVGVDFKIN